MSERVVKKAMKQMKCKKSAGTDVIYQDCLILGTDVIVTPITKIINSSISINWFTFDIAIKANDLMHLLMPII